MLYKNSNHKERKHPCRRCLHVFSSEDLLTTHKIDCQGIGEKPQRTVMPEEGKNILKFVKKPQTDAGAIHHLCRL